MLVIFPKDSSTSILGDVYASFGDVRLRNALPNTTAPDIWHHERLGYFGQPANAV